MLHTYLSTALSTGFRKVCGAALAVFLLVALAANYAGATGKESSEMIKITLGKATVFNLPPQASDVMVADPKIVDVSALQINQLYLVGSTLGNTNIIVLDKEGRVSKNVNVNVGIDTAVIQETIDRTFPSENNVQIHVVGNQVALMGSVSTPAVAQRISKLVAAQVGDMRGASAGSDSTNMIENLLEVRGQQQVTLRVRILEVSRNVLKELGIETTTRNATNTTAGFRPSASTTSKTGLTKDPFGITSLVFNSGFGTIGDIAVLLNALENDGLTNVLAEPNLTAISGEKAGFLAGGEFPIPAGRDQNGNITIEYKQFGVSLNFKPIVMSDDRISLQLDTEVSSLDQAQGLTLNDIQIPGLDVRRASTTVEINSGGSLMMAGLLKSNNIKGMSGLPGIKDTPVLGDLVSSKSFQREETELVVIVTPYLVQPYAETTMAKPIYENDLGELLPPPPPTTAMAVGDKGKPVPLYTKEEAKKEAVKSQVKKAPVQNSSPINNVFGNNMKKIYGDRVRNVPSNQSFGYMND